MLLTESNKERNPSKGSLSKVTMVASVFVIFLALGAMFWPQNESAPHGAVFLVLDPSAGSQRIQQLYKPLLSLLAKADGQALRLEMAATAADFQAKAEQGASYLLCSDGVALGLSSEQYIPLVAGRRAAPQNLRPQGCVVFRKGTGFGFSNWRADFSKVIVGDSLSLLVNENLKGYPVFHGAVGPDPYDHAPVLHALRLADFDYALVRHWDALRFFESRLLSKDQWGMELLGAPWPDLVLFADRGLSASQRVKSAEVLAAVGRRTGKENDGVALVLNGLKGVNLAGFNLLLEPDFELVRKRAKENWPAKGN